MVDKNIVPEDKIVGEYLSVFGLDEVKNISLSSALDLIASDFLKNGGGMDKMSPYANERMKNGELDIGKVNENYLNTLVEQNFVLMNQNEILRSALYG